MHSRTSQSEGKRDIAEPVELLRRAARDPFYRAMIEAGADAKQLFQAGLFIDSLPVPVQEHGSWNPQLTTTPVGKLLDRVTALQGPAATPGDEWVVLLSTGSFSPVHRGHVAMMEAAAQRLVEAGLQVLGGYLSPSHDEYVSTKQSGQAAMHAEDRIALLEEALADHAWLSVCPWEARYAPVALNFTDVLMRLEQYLQVQLSKAPQFQGQSVRVAYVFGSDNVFFLEAFRGRGLAVCVERGELHDAAAELLAQLSSDQHQAPARLFWAGSTEHRHASSTRVRGGERALVPAQAQARYLALRREHADARQELYLVRQDLAHGTAGWGASAQAQGEFCKGLEAVLGQALCNTSWRIRWLALEQQQGLCVQLQERARVLSLDACVAGNHQLHVSRRFDLCDGQVRSRVMAQRPGTAALLDQVQALPRATASWVVVDDDTSTGQTEAFVRMLLQTNGHVDTQFIYLNELLLAQTEQSKQAIADVVDARDFLLGAKDAGLVVRLPDGRLARAPYMLPFTNLSFRACLPGPEVWKASLALWKLNEAWFAQLPMRLCVSHASPGCQALLQFLGFAPETSLEAVCRQMRAQLDSCAA